MAEFENIEFHRSGYGMLPDMGDKDPGLSVCFPRNAGGPIFTGKCDCRESRRGKGCAHFERLLRATSQIKKRHGGRSWGDDFSASLWSRLASILSEGDGVLCSTIQVARRQQDGTWGFFSPRDSLLARLLDNSEISLRFLERAGKVPEPNRFRDRASLIRQLSAALCGDEERRINQAGVLTFRQRTEQSFWGVLAYHCYREYGVQCTFRPAIEQSSGDFVIKCHPGGRDPLLELVLPRRQVRKALGLLAAEFPKQPDLLSIPCL